MMTETKMDPEMAVERWLPIHIEMGPNSLSIRWMDFGMKRISEPFLAQTIQALRSRTPPAREHTTQTASLRELPCAAAPARPAGMIFHVSRCGSSLLVNALRTAQAVEVIAESPVVAAFFQPNAFRGSPVQPERVDETRRLYLEWVVGQYASAARATAQKVVIKWYAADLLRISQIRSVWPDVPCVILIRDPIEVLVSHIADPYGWATWKASPLAAGKAFGWTGQEVTRMSTEEYYARCFGRFCEAASRQVDTPCRVIDYEDLNYRMLREVAALFGIEIPSADASEVTRLFSTYAKDPMGTRPFFDDRRLKRSRTPESLKQAVEEWTRARYDALKTMRAQ
jgi:hypothetical protein